MKRNAGFAPVFLMVVSLIILGAAIGLYMNRINIRRYFYHGSTTVVIVRDNTLHQPGVSNFTVLAHGWNAAKLLADIKSLKQVPDSSFPINCPNGDGVTYTFTFSNPRVTAEATPRECEFVIYNQHSYYSDDNFWNDVKAATGQSIDPYSG